MTNSDFLITFFSVLFAFIVKDFYDIYLRNFVISLLKRYKISITKVNNKKR